MASRWDAARYFQFGWFDSFQPASPYIVPFLRDYVVASIRHVPEVRRLTFVLSLWTYGYAVGLILFGGLSRWCPMRFLIAVCEVLNVIQAVCLYLSSNPHVSEQSDVDFGLVYASELLSGMYFSVKSLYASHLFGVFSSEASPRATAVVRTLQLLSILVSALVGQFWMLFCEGAHRTETCYSDLLGANVVFCVAALASSVLLPPTRILSDEPASSELFLPASLEVKELGVLANANVSQMFVDMDSDPHAFERELAYPSGTLYRRVDESAIRFVARKAGDCTKRWYRSWFASPMQCFMWSLWLVLCYALHSLVLVYWASLAADASDKLARWDGFVLCLLYTAGMIGAAMAWLVEKFWSTCPHVQWMGSCVTWTCSPAVLCVLLALSAAPLLFRSVSSQTSSEPSHAFDFCVAVLCLAAYNGVVEFVVPLAYGFVGTSLHQSAAHANIWFAAVSLATVLAGTGVQAILDAIPGAATDMLIASLSGLYGCIAGLFILLLVLGALRRLALRSVQAARFEMVED